MENSRLIRKVSFGELEQILILQRKIFRSVAEIYDDFEIGPLVQTLDQMVLDFEKGIFLVMIQNNEIVGSVRGFVSGDTLHIGKLMIDPSYQNKGLGTRLMQAIENQCSRLANFELFTGHKSTRNLYLYNKIGYREYKVEKVNEKLSRVYLMKKNPKKIS
jgi:GNAT superfamily N-acetyltransferase